MRPYGVGKQGWGGQGRMGNGEGGPAPPSVHPAPTHSVIIPEKLDSFINKFAEYTHEKWAFDKVSLGLLFTGLSFPAGWPQTPVCPNSFTPGFSGALRSSWAYPSPCLPLQPAFSSHL